MISTYSQLVATPGSDTIDTQISAMASAQTTEDWFFESMTGGSRSDSGETVNPTTALGHGPVWQAVNILAGDVGQLPFWKMIETAAGRNKDRNHPLNYSLSCEPNPWQTPSVWKETMMANCLLWGNAVSVIQRLRNGRVWLIPLSPDVTAYEEIAPGDFVITTRINNEPKAFPYEDCFHVRGLQSNGFWGLSAVAVAKNVLGHGLALQAHGNRTFKNDARPSGVLRTDAAFNAEAHKNLRKEWQETQGGANRNSIAILWEGLEFKPMSMSNEDSQWLEARKLDREFVASLFNLPAFKLNAMENSAVRANLEEQNRDYFQTSLSRWTNRFAEEAKRKLLTKSQQVSGGHWFKWFPEAFLRGDIQKRMTSYGIAITHRIMSPNEARRLEDMNPYEGGDEYLNPAIEPAGGDNVAAQQGKTAELIESQIGAVLAIEAYRVENAGRTAKNYVAWAEKFYGDADLMTIWKERLTIPCEVANLIGIAASWEETFARHCRNSWDALLTLMDLATPATQAAAAKDRAAHIRTLTKQLTKEILSGE